MGGEPFSHYELSYGYTGYGYTFGTRIDDPRRGEVTIGSLTANASYTFKMVAVNESSRSEERRVGKECRSRWSPYH